MTTPTTPTSPTTSTASVTEIVVPTGTARPFALTAALLWRLVHEGRRHLLSPVVPFVLTLAVTVITSCFGGDSANSAGAFLSLASDYSDGGHAVTVGILLTLGPGTAAVFNAASVTRAVQGLVGAEVARGGFEELLGSPYTPRRIATAVLGFTLATATGFWAVYTAITAAVTGAFVAATSVHLHLPAAYVALVTVFPLLIAWTSGSLALLVSLLFPRLTQVGVAAALSGGNLGNVVAVLPGLGAVFVLSYGLPSLGPARLLLIAGGATLLIACASVVLVTVRFDPETVLDS
ncbi:hypothetical protein [Streptomyces sp. UNOC14_S4]|uniref:hypothetical protein n=1 Tax=Streptomyces sp. UNOC14_S4 TaxID=2872340 RepID=UPI001E36D4A9|nr:hypothetical protein [Streptomyces sp. UNOC14_S4]MCC3767926.1 hypothetical protein [Streptomyces sp. UNOC14_S4]